MTVVTGAVVEGGGSGLPIGGVGLLSSSTAAGVAVGAVAPVKAVPHDVQNFWPDWTLAPQDGQNMT